MNVTYMFRATNRPDRTLPEHAVHAGSDDRPVAGAVRRGTPPPKTTRDAEAPAPALVLAEPVDDTALAHSAPAASVRAASAPARQLARYALATGRIILVAKARGGIGATTLAVNLALEMQLQANRRRGAVGGRVALVDLDVQMGNAGSFLDLADCGGMLALARLGPEPDSQAVRHAMVRHASGLHVLAAPSVALPFEAFDATRIASLLDALTSVHDIVIIDLPPALIDWLEPVLARAERLLMVTDLAVPSIARAHRILSQMAEDRPDLPVEIVVAHERKPFRLGQTHRDAEAALAHGLRHWLPDEAKLARQALDRGEPLVQLAPRCGWSRAIKAMATDLLTSIESDAMTAPGRDH